MFQQVINLILSIVKWKPGLVYSYNIVIFSKTVEEHMAYVEQVLSVQMEPV